MYPTVFRSDFSGRDGEVKLASVWGIELPFRLLCSVNILH